MTTPAPSRPPAAGCELLDAGATWDAIRVPRSVGVIALEILGARSGAVIEDPVAPALYWLVPEGSAARWDIVGTHALSRGHTLTVPPARRTVGPGPHWRVCPGDEAWLTDADALRAAIEDAYDPTARSTGAAAQRRPAPVLQPSCKFGQHTWCKPGPVHTSYGDLAIPARRCDCSCHAGKAVQ